MAIRPILSALTRNKTGALLVALQVALSLAILANALYVVSVRQAVAARPSGVAAEEDVFLLRQRPVREASFAQTLAAQKLGAAALRAVPGVVSVALVNRTPLSRNGNTTSIAVNRSQVQPSAAAAHYQSPDSLVRTWGLKLVEGRDFNAGDVQEIDGNTSEDSARSVIITRALADATYPGVASVVGKPLYFGTGADASEARIIGVVERLQSMGAQTGGLGETSLIAPVRDDSENTYSIRAEPGQRERVMREAEAALRKAWPAPILTRVKTMQQDRVERYRADHALSWMLVTVSLLLLTITASGIVGIASLWVAQRRKQIGVRRALGARRTDVLRYFITENLLITSAGIVAGVLLALALNQLLVSRLELARLPPAYLAGGAAVFWLLGVAAVYGPAWRAASISPATATRGA